VGEKPHRSPFVATTMCAKAFCGGSRVALRKWVLLFRSAQLHADSGEKRQRCGGLTPSRNFREFAETILEFNRIGGMRHMALRLSAILLILLSVAIGYYEYGRPGAFCAVGAISLILFAIWVDRTA
jgi:hypothetical protein